MRIRRPSLCRQVCRAGLALAAIPVAGGGCGGGSNAGPAGTFSDAELEAQHCALDRSAVQYTAGTDESAGETALAAGRSVVPCLTLTDLGGVEASIVVSRSGTVTYAPVFTADGTGLIQSTDHGVTWSTITPKDDSGRGHARPQPYLYRDPLSNRMFFTTTAFSGFYFSWSDDDGATWNWDPLVARDTKDWIKIFSGPPVSSTPAGYPSLVYTSSPSPISTPGITGTPSFQAVYKSVDGGATFTEVGKGKLSLKPADAGGCAANEWVIFGNGAVGKDGTVYISLRRCTRFAVAVSTNEGDDFVVHEVPGGTLPAWDTTQITAIVTNPNFLITEPLTTDADGNLYAVWPDQDAHLRMAISRDAAQTWSDPLVVAAPSVTKVRYGNVAAQKPGTIAIGYYGTTDGTAYNAYIAESTNALDASPTFTSLIVNDPSDPLYPADFDSGYAGTLTGGDLNEIVQVKYAPDGDIWGSFVKDMCPGTTTSKTNCAWDVQAHAGTMFQAAVGRVVHR